MINIVYSFADGGNTLSSWKLNIAEHLQPTKWYLFPTVDHVSCSFFASLSDRHNLLYILFSVHYYLLVIFCYINKDSPIKNISIIIVSIGNRQLIIAKYILARYITAVSIPTMGHRVILHA